MNASSVRAVVVAAAVMFVFLVPRTICAQDGTDRPLPSYRDKNRLLLVFAPNAQDPTYLEQTRLWATEKAGFDERQLVVIPVLSDAHRVAGDTPAGLEKKYGVEPHIFTTVLLGKDGYDAYRSARPIRPEALYATIDAMPQRRAEARHSPTASPSAPTPAPSPTRPPKPDLDHDE